MEARLATDYLVVGLTLTFICGVIFTTLGFNDRFPRSAVYFMFSTVAWYATSFLLWMSDTASIVGIPWLFVFFAMICFVMVLFESLRAFQLYRREQRGYW